MVAVLRACLVDLYPATAGYISLGDEDDEDHPSLNINHTIAAIIKKIMHISEFSYKYVS